MDALKNLESWRLGSRDREFSLHSCEHDPRIAEIHLMEGTLLVESHEGKNYNGEIVTGLERLIAAALDEWDRAIKAR